MAEQVNSNYPKRVKFLAGEQKKFLELVMQKLDANANGLAKIIGVHPRTIRDWRREKLTISLPALDIFCGKAGLESPHNIKIIEPFWLASLSARNGWEAVVKKYGRVPVNEEYRKKKWYEWWYKKGRFMPHPLTNIYEPIKKPRRSSKLAEFVGIMLGDGGITRNQLSITLNKIVDREYSNFVVELLEELFTIRPSKLEIKNAKVFRISISRTELVGFCQKIGLVIGHKIKQQIDIPEWVKVNKNYALACLRGLIDTDGCVFRHSYKVNGKTYSYRKLGFVSLSTPLRNSVFSIMQNIGLTPRLAANRDVRLDSKNDIQSYFSLVGSHNPKHLKKYQSVL